MNRSRTMNSTEHEESVHGGIDFEELKAQGLSPCQVIDFSSNILPYGPAPSVIQSIRQVDFSSYPDRSCYELRQSLAIRYGVDFHSILVGNGCCELIHQIALGIVRPGDIVLVCGPTFSEYARATRIAGGEVEWCNSAAANDFAISCEQIEVALDSKTIRLAWICNPNNPTGQTVPPQAIRHWLLQYPHTIFVVDESYVEFVTGIESLIDCDANNLIVLRSMTKAYAMAGLRLGFAMMREPWISIVRERCVPWSVSSIAQVAGMAALRETRYYDEALRRLSASKRRLTEELTRCGFRTISGSTSFFLMATSDSKQLRQRLLKHGLLIRDCASFGLEGFVRIASGTEDQNVVLVSRLTERDVASVSNMGST